MRNDRQGDTCREKEFLQLEQAVRELGAPSDADFTLYKELERSFNDATLSVEWRKRYGSLMDGIASKYIERIETDLSRKRMLLIENVNLNVLLVKRMLEKIGVNVISAEDGEAGIDIARREQPDLIATRILLPGLSGFDIIRRLKSDPQTWNIPIIVTSAYSHQPDVDMAYEIGATDYIFKPIVWDRLISSVSTQLRLADARKFLSTKN